MAGAHLSVRLGGKSGVFTAGIIILIQVCSATSASAATYYVDKSNSAASDNNPGSSTQPWATISHAASVAGPGDTVTVKAGTYPERVSLTRSGASGQEIVFRADPPRSVSMQGFVLSGDYLRVEGFTVENTTQIGFHIRGNHLAIVNNAVLDIPQAAVMGDPVGDYPNWCTDVYVADNYFEHVNFGIVAVGFDWLVERNEVNRVFNEGIAGDADYSRFFGSRLTFRHNYFHGTTLQDISGLNGVWDGGGSSDDAHLDCWQSFINNKPSGTEFTDIVFDGNILRNFSQAVHWEAIDAGSRYRNIQFINNVIVPEQGDERDSRVGINVYEVTGFIVENNTFIGTTGQAVSVRNSDQISVRMNIYFQCAWAYAWDSATTNASDDANIIFETGVPYNITPNGPLYVDPGLIDPSRIPNNWNEAFAADAGWRVANSTYAVYGSQIPVLSGPSTTLATDDSFTGVQEDSAGASLDVLANDPGMGLSIVSVSTPSNSGTATIAGGQSITYTPAANFYGTETFRYAVQDGTGATDTANVSVTVSNVNDPPTAVDDTYPNITAGTSNNTLNVLANDSTSPDPSESLIITSVGVPNQGGSVSIQNGTALSYTPAAGFSGTETFAYTINDGNGGSDTANVSVTVQAVNNPPTANSDSYSGIIEDSSSNLLNVLSNDSTAPDTGETLTIVDLGIPSKGGTVSLGSGGVLYTPAANFAGTETFTYTVDDGSGATDTATVTVSVTEVNDPPIARNDQFSVLQDTSGNILEVLANDTDADADVLTITDLGLPTDGGTVSVAGGNALSYTPAPSFVGTETFTYTVGDGRGGSSSASVSVTVNDQNSAPIASSDSYTVDLNSTSDSLDVLSNDSDPDPNDTLTISAVGRPSNGGSVSISGGTSLVYSPPQNFTGTETFSYTVADPAGASASAQVDISVQDLSPTTTNDTFKVRGNSENNRMDVLKNDKAKGGGNGLTLTTADSTTKDVASVITIDGNQVLYTPPKDFTGIDTFVYTVEDDKGRTASGQVTVEVTDTIGVGLCEDYPAIQVELAEMRADLGLAEPDMDADGIADDYMLEVLQVVSCYDKDTELSVALRTAYKINLLQFDAEAGAADLAKYREAIAALMTVSTDMQSSLAQILEQLALPVTQFYETVWCDDETGICMPKPLPDTPLEEGYQTFEETRITLEQPFSALGDPDKDGKSNLDEFVKVVESGGGSSDFAMAATDPALDGSQSAPRADSGSSRGGACFIATAAYGTPLAADINVLRDVRDRYLLVDAAGAAFVDTYYRLSPPVARVVADHPAVAALIRVLLTPIIALSRLVLIGPWYLASLAALFPFFVALWRRRRGPRTA